MSEAAAIPAPPINAAPAAASPPRATPSSKAASATAAAAPAPPAPTVDPTSEAAAYPARGQLPPEYVSIPIWASQRDAPLKVCVICRKGADAIQGQLVVRRDLVDATVYLGCLSDAFGVVELLELWVQNVQGLAEASKVSTLASDAVNNTTVDARWAGLFETTLKSWPGGYVACGYEQTNPPPTWLDVANGRPVHPAGWQLCRSDRALRAAHLPPFSTSLSRYLFKPSTGTADDSTSTAGFVPVLDECPTNASTQPIDRALPEVAGLVPFNPGGGFVIVKPAGTLRVAELRDVLSGKPFAGQVYGRSSFRFGAMQPLNAPGNGFLFPAKPDGAPSRLVETFLLKMQLLSGMIEDVGRFTLACRRPLLNLSPGSFVARVDQSNLHLPALWTTRVNLVDAGDAIPLNIPQGETNFAFHVPGKSVGLSLYQPDIITRRWSSGFAHSIYLSHSTDTKAGTVFEGTLTIVDLIRPTINDILRVRLPIQGKRVDLYLRVDLANSPSPAVLQFKTVPDLRIKDDVAALKAYEGRPIQDVSFEFYPLFSSACDVYSLAVIATEILLTARQDLPPALQHVLNLASRCRELARAEATAKVPLDRRIQQIFGEDPRWMTHLSPAAMVVGSTTPDRAMRAVTPELWFATLAMLVRMFPAAGPDSLLANFGDMLNGNMFEVYKVLLGHSLGLIQRSRSMLFGEWGVNRHVGAILDEHRAAFTREQSK